MKTKKQQAMDRSGGRQMARKAIIYARARHLSSNGSDKASEAADISRQLKGCEATVTRLGVQVVQEFADVGASADDMQRPGLVALLDRLKANDLDYVIVAGADRLARSAPNYRQIEQHVASGGADLLIARPADGRSRNSEAAHQMLASVTAVMAALYSHEHGLAIRRGRARARHQTKRSHCMS